MQLLEFSGAVRLVYKSLGVKGLNGNWITHVTRRDCLLKQLTTEEKTEGEQEVTGRQGRRRKQLMGGLKERRGYWNLKKEALDRTVWG